MKVFITEYALTKGIQEFDIDDNQIEYMITVQGNQFHGEGKSWHCTREEAIARAEQMRLAKIKSLRKSIDKLEKMRFE